MGLVIDQHSKIREGNILEKWLLWDLRSSLWPKNKGGGGGPPGTLPDFLHQSFSTVESLQPLSFTISKHIFPLVVFIFLLVYLTLHRNKNHNNKLKNTELHVPAPVHDVGVVLVTFILSHNWTPDHGITFPISEWHPRDIMKISSDVGSLSHMLSWLNSPMSSFSLYMLSLDKTPIRRMLPRCIGMLLE